MTKPYKIFLVFASVSILLALLVSKPPLNGVHWDSPIYLTQAKQFADTAYLMSFSAHAPEIALQVRTNTWPQDESFSEAFWHFARLGHIVVLGSVVSVFGSNAAGLQAATGLYIALTLLSVGFSAATADLAIELLGDPARKANVHAAVAFSALLYGASDIFGYLAGNLVSEVPALFLVSAGAWLLLKALQRRSILMAVASGLLAFALYAVRMESVLSYIAFFLALALTLLWRARQLLWVGGFAAAALAAMAAYGLYAWVFHPLASPDVFLKFAVAQRNILRGGTTAPTDLVIAGGALWVGLLMSLRLTVGDAATRFALIWLALTALPWMPGIVLNLPSQARMMAFVLPPLFLASTLGWAALFVAAKLRPGLAGFFVVLALLMVAFSNPLAYGVASSLPGLWRLQYARALLAVRGYEQQNYAVNELAGLSREIYAGPLPAIVTYESSQLRQEDLNVVRFFGPAYPRDADMARQQEPANLGPCDRMRFDPRIEPVVYCTEWKSGTKPSAQSSAVRMFRLQVAPIEQLRLGATHFQLTPWSD